MVILLKVLNLAMPKGCSSKFNKFHFLAEANLNWVLVTCNWKILD